MQQGDGEYRYLGDGDGLALEVLGPTVASCLARAVEGFVAAFADVHPSVVGADHEIALAGDGAGALLRGAIEEALRLGRAGHLPVTAIAEVFDDGHAVLHLEAIPVGLARMCVLPPLLSWQEVSLERDDGHWRGRILCHPAPARTETRTLKS